ncbi:hypothetical protein POSPLADRAFT_1147895 [Postia placenta MAD-698-R-SB12]|uniref:Uncharacterized protein n=1 Tax=Postia placenta MAD-698-R-SB12 TaxID=670580 RepID=A0A1X6MW07_9APHY|nr:hypothetical protein POSPLADRAFT_1147895 [Postia placenta MAD-698-R-SB12]OSX60565.1 hypothetical protein POSPLADRAFT_1147895 [Postia placenta MAD-698-R-SB12]
MSGNKSLSDAEQLDEIDKLYATLDNNEEPWRDRQRFLEHCGYMLRPRYHPGWVPSWRSTRKDPILCKDGTFLPVGHDISV